MNPGLTVAVIDDDEAVLNSLRMILTAMISRSACLSPPRIILLRTMRKRLAASFATFACRTCPASSCRRSCTNADQPCQLFLITGHGNISMAISAVKAGAYDFLEKPFSPDRLIEAIKGAVDKAHHKLAEDKDLQRLASRVNELSDRQKQVMDLAVKGLSNKEIAQLSRSAPAPFRPTELGSWRRRERATSPSWCGWRCASRISETFRRRLVGIFQFARSFAASRPWHRGCTGSFRRSVTGLCWLAFLRK